MTIHRINTLQDYFERMVGKTIDEVAIFDDELVIFLDDGSEVCLWGDGLSMQINDRPEFDD